MQTKMRNLVIKTKLFLRSERGTTAIEYALIASLVSVTIIGAVGSIGSNISQNFYEKLIGLI